MDLLGFTQLMKSIDSSPAKGQPVKTGIQAKILIEKKTIINLLGAFAVAVKHYLRGEHVIFYE